MSIISLGQWLMEKTVWYSGNNTVLGVGTPFFFLINFYWGIVSLQCYVFLLHSRMNQPYVYIYPYLPFRFPSHLDHNSALSRVLCAIWYVLNSYIFYT